MKLGIIVAVSDNNVIGKDGKLPWPKIPGDLPRFKRLTLGNPVIMGRKTYESLPEGCRPLPGRKNIVLSKFLNYGGAIFNYDKYGCVFIARTIEEALRFAEEKDSWVIGGEKIYEQFLPLSDGMEVTRVKGNFEGDAYFPAVDWDEWAEVSREDYQTHSFVSYTRRQTI